MRDPFPDPRTLMKRKRRVKNTAPATSQSTTRGRAVSPIGISNRFRSSTINSGSFDRAAARRGKALFSGLYMNELLMRLMHRHDPHPELFHYYRGAVEALGRTAAIGPANLSEPESAPGLLEAASAALGPISILVNSASGFPEDTLADAGLTVVGPGLVERRKGRVDISEVNLENLVLLAEMADELDRLEQALEMHHARFSFMVGSENKAIWSTSFHR